MTNEAVVFVLFIVIFIFSEWLVCWIHSLSQKIDRLELIINQLKYTHKKEDEHNG